MQRVLRGLLGVQGPQVAWDWSGPELGLPRPPCPSNAFEETKEALPHQQGGQKRKQGHQD